MLGGHLDERGNDAMPGGVSHGPNEGLDGSGRAQEGGEVQTASRQLQVASGVAPPACDACRSRKVKCTPLDGDEDGSEAALAAGIKCKLCVKRKEACTYDYVYKKPGRPLGSTKRTRKSNSPESASSPSSSRQRQRTGTMTSQPDDATHAASASSPSHPFLSTNYSRLFESRSNSPRFDYSIPTGSTPGSGLGAGGGGNGGQGEVGFRIPAPPVDTSVGDTGITPWNAAYGPHAGTGPATGTIFGSALSAMHSDHTFSDLFPGPGFFGGMGNLGSGTGANGTEGASQGVGLGGGGFMPDASMGRPSQLSSSLFPGDGGLMPGIMVDLGPNLQGQTPGYTAGMDGMYGRQQAAQGRPHRPWVDNQANGSFRPDTAGSSGPYASSNNNGSPSTGVSVSDTPKIPHPATRPDIPQIESVAPWQDICFFLSLHMKHQHGLMPLVHKPSFAQDVLQRRDLSDEVFRGLLCSIVSYTICQLPIQLTSHKYSRTELELLLRRCQRTSRAIQLRWHMAPCLESLASLQLDTNTALGCTQLDLASALIADIRRQVYSLGLHKAEPREGLDFLQIQICRRLFWEIYQSDKTNVMNAISPISLNDMEGVPPLPLEIDDDYLTTSTSTPQPAGRISYMTGFVAVSRIFEILGQCQIRQRTWSNNPDAGPGRTELSRWVDDNQVKMRDILHDLPKALRADGGSRDKGGFDKADESSLGIQRANIHITALCVDFALLDFKVHLRPELDTKAEREQLARKAYTTLSSMPIEYLASNGESMRGKVLRIVLDLLSHCPEPGIFGQDVWNWWNMVQFFQIIPEKEDGNAEERDDRPPSSAGPPDQR